MHFYLIVMIILLSIAVLFLFLRLHLYRKSLQSIRKQLKQIRNEDTNAVIRVDYPREILLSLADEINEMLKQNRRTLIEAKQIDQRFRDSITNISHDLRTPLTTASGYTGMLKSGGLTREEELEYLAIIEERQDMVKTLLEQLFCYARLEAGCEVWELKQIDMRRILSEVLAAFYNDICKKDMEPDIVIEDKKMMIMGDEEGLRRIFSNIIFNGLTHGDSNYQIKLQEKDKGFAFLFSDKTKGLTHTDVELLFQRYYTGNRSGKGIGTGLGLTIAKELTERMNGRIKATLVGEQFTIEIWMPSL